MPTSDEPEISVAVSPADETAAAIDGAIVGELDGLLWEDSTGVDIVSVTIEWGQVAVPVEHGDWLNGGVVELGCDEEQLRDAPLLNHLQHLSASATIEQIAEHYSLNLGGPPPGPDPQPLPPWWGSIEETGD